MVRVHLFECTIDGYSIPLYKTALVGFSEFKRLLDAGIIVRLGVLYALYEKSV